MTTNKDQSPTPRTDAVEMNLPPRSSEAKLELLKYARTLEHELSSAKEEIERLKQQIDDSHSTWM